MATKIGSENNAYAGGITYTTPALQMGTFSNAAPNSGFSFDLPLATINNMTNNALNFSAASSAQNRGLISGIAYTAQEGVNRQANASTNFMTGALTQQHQSALSQTGALERMFQGFLGTSQHAADAGVQVAEAQNSGGCFITTAICEAEEKADDCDELQTLRSFRDHYMMADASGRELVAEYYAKAPAIVEAVKNRPDSAWCFDHLKVRYLQPAIAAVKDGRNDDALYLYTMLFIVAKSMAA